MPDLIVHDGVVVSMDDRDRLVSPGTVVVDDGRIVAVRPTDEGDRSPAAAARTIDADGDVVVPGLVDAHRHTDFSLVGGLFDDLDPGVLLREAMALYHGAEETLGESFFEAAWRLACLRQVANGVTTVNAMDFTPRIGARTVGETGLRAVIGPELSDFLDPRPPAEQVADARAFVEDYHGAYDDRVRASIAPGGETGCSRALWAEVADLRRAFPGLRLHTHLLDTSEAGLMARGGGADDPLSLLDEHGLLDERTLLTHCIHADREDARRIADAGASVLHCATVYSYFRAGERAWFPLPALREFDVPVAIGLDDPFWFGHWDLLREGKHARVLANYEYGAHQWSSYDLLGALTRDAADALDLPVGRLEAGGRADLVVLGVDDARHRPSSDVPALVANALSGGDVRTTIVDGEVLYHEGTVATMDVADVVASAERERERLCAETGWETTLAGSSPPETSILRRVNARPVFRMLRHAARGAVGRVVG